MSDRKRIQPWSFFRAILRLAWNAFALFGMGVVLYFSCFNVSRITSPSMAPTLQGTSWEDGDVVLTEKITFKFRRPRRWEAIMIRRPDDILIIKRVVGLPGETIRMPEPGHIVINDREVALPPSLRFLKHLPFGNLTGDQQFECGDGYYVLGDDSKDSDDSRFNGTVSPNAIIGRAWLILAPGSRRGRVNSGE